MSRALALSPQGNLLLETDDQTELKLSADVAAQLEERFGADSAHGLELLASQLLHEPLPPTLVFWRELAQRFYTALCHLPDLGALTTLQVPVPGLSDWRIFMEGAPPMKGFEYLSEAVLAQLWAGLEAHVGAAIAQTKGGAAAYLRDCNPVWNAVGRVTFHLAENKRNPAYPFAFLATYSHRVSEQGKVQHLPLGRALEQYAGAKNRAALATLLSPVQRAAEKCKLVRELLESRAIFHPQVWRPDQAFAFLKDIPLLEQTGVLARIPDWWKSGRPPRPQVGVRIGNAQANLLGTKGLLDFKVELSLEGEPLTAEEWQTLRQSSNGLVLLKGRWVEVDQAKLQEVLDHWKKVQRAAGQDGVSLLEGLRLLSGFQPQVAADQTVETERAEWSRVVAGAGFQQILEQMQNPEVSAESDPGPDLCGTLRPYQRQGSHWLWFMNRLGLGACLADDMGLGKTIQVISLLLALRRGGEVVGLVSSGQTKSKHALPKAGPAGPSLLVVPASLIANWKKELQKFAPSLSVCYAHPAEASAEALAAASRPGSLDQTDLVITSYSMVVRLDWLKQVPWNVVILDEAQAIKNPGARQTRAVKELPGRHRIALSGTPIENRLSDLWSLFDFLCPGLLGNAKDFAAFVKSRSQLNQPGGTAFAPLRRLVRPYILRRLKTDKTIIADLPDKTEMAAFCTLTRRQAALYQQSVEDLAERLDAPEVEGIQRRGIVLAFLTRLKQICNHPSQWLGDGSYDPAESGKFQRLGELSEEIASRQEKMLLFTQYQQATEPLSRHLQSIFGAPGFVLHGQTPVKKRQQLVDDFQNSSGGSFFVLSLKAGGTGLNLTAASHVVHFDRWWNPAVENQATDRAFRIGQKRNVMVHKFICRGTLEERIAELITTKSSLAEDVLGEGTERLLTEMNNAELLRFVSLDIRAATTD